MFLNISGLHNVLQSSTQCYFCILRIAAAAAGYLFSVARLIFLDGADEIVAARCLRHSPRSIRSTKMSQHDCGRGCGCKNIVIQCGSGGSRGLGATSRDRAPRHKRQLSRRPLSAKRKSPLCGLAKDLRESVCVSERFGPKRALRTWPHLVTRQGEGRCAYLVLR